MNNSFTKGMRDGIPTALGYLSVSFGFGILAINLGLSVFEAVLISITNLTSAGQVAGVSIITAGGTLVEMILTQLVLNIRYSLMGLSLSQKLDKKFNTFHRMVTSFGITDENFAVAYSQTAPITPSYMYGMISVSAAGWVLGTLLGAVAGNMLPAALTDAMGILVYGMFIAIIIPPARKSRGILTAIIIGASCSIVIKYVFTFISSGFSVIISAVIAATVCAIFFPLPTEDSDKEGAS